MACRNKIAGYTYKLAIKILYALHGDLNKFKIQEYHHVTICFNLDFHEFRDFHVEVEILELTAFIVASCY